VAARYSARTNGISSAAITRLDVLDPMETIKVCTAYRVNGETTDTMPAASAAMGAAEPIYEELPGWQQPTANVRRFKELPAEAQRYVRFIESILGAPICLVSVGPEREQAISLDRII
jgi:adenylosuccinate synthase